MKIFFGRVNEFKNRPTKNLMQGIAEYLKNALYQLNEHREHRSVGTAANGALRIGLLAGIALAAPLAILNPARAAESLKIGPAHALSDYTKRLLVGDTDSRRFGNGFAVADFNEDGRVDVVMHIHGPDPNNRRFAVRVYLQDANGAFVEDSEYPLPNVGILTWALEAADFNGDGHLDIVMDDIGNDLVMMLGNGDGIFQAATSLGLGASGFFAVGDLNADQRLDLVAGNLVGTVGVFTGAGDGTFMPGATLDTYASPSFPPTGRVMIGDLNGDGKLDIAVASSTRFEAASGNLDVFLGNGDGTFQDVIRTPNVAAAWGALGDFNADGTLDYAGNRFSPKELEIWLGSGDGHFTKHKVYSPTVTYAVGLTVADVNYDEISDIIVSGQSAGGQGFAAVASIFLGKGDGSFQAAQSFTAVTNYGFGNMAMVVKDVDGDGLVDLVGTAENPALVDKEEILVGAFSKGVKRDPTLGFLLNLEHRTPGASGSVVLEASTNLVNWTAVTTNSAPKDTWPVVDMSVSGQSKRFYRTRRAP
jgi:hypothetical protein